MVSVKVEYNPSDRILNEINRRGHREIIRPEREIAPGPLGLWLERTIVAAMFLFVIAAPNSIAATQTAWMLGMLFWLLRFLVWPRPKLYRTPIDYPMFGFFLLTGLSSFLSYEPSVSIGKLRAASLFTIVYLFAENIRSPKILRVLTVRSPNHGSYPARRTKAYRS
ncbi:MAG: hypothetical protein DMF72_09510 [Acidobacteria bacterium]|nr:MAG: hypothetical protein DMF72_09510 [Acidobacteriota bacterium]